MDDRDAKDSHNCDLWVFMSADNSGQLYNYRVGSMNDCALNMWYYTINLLSATMTDKPQVIHAFN